MERPASDITSEPAERPTPSMLGRPLSAREREVLTALAAGETGDELAKRLVIAPETVRRHVANAREKLGARTRVHAVALALHRGDIEPDLGPRRRARFRRFPVGAANSR